MSGMVNADELMVLAFAVCDERATDAQIERIEEILDGNRAAKLLYLECLDLHSDLEYRGRRFGLHRPVAEKIITAQIGEFLPDQLLAEPAAHPGGDGPAAAHGTVPVIGYPWLPLSLVSSVHGRLMRWPGSCWSLASWQPGHGACPVIARTLNSPAACRLACRFRPPRPRPPGKRRHLQSSRKGRPIFGRPLALRGSWARPPPRSRRGRSSAGSRQ